MSPPQFGRVLVDGKVPGSRHRKEARHQIEEEKTLKSLPLVALIWGIHGG